MKSEKNRLPPAFLHATQLEQIGALIAIGLSVFLSAIGSLKTPMILGAVLFWALGVYLIFYMPETGFKPLSPTERGSWKSMGKNIKNRSEYVKSPSGFNKNIIDRFFFTAFTPKDWTACGYPMSWTVFSCRSKARPSWLVGSAG